MMQLVVRHDPLLPRSLRAWHRVRLSGLLCEEVAPVRQDHAGTNGRHLRRLPGDAGLPQRRAGAFQPFNHLPGSYQAMSICDCNQGRLPCTCKTQLTGEYHADLNAAQSELTALREDFDRVTAERDAALGREDMLREEVERQNDIAHAAKVECSKLQQRLTAADERADVLEGLLNRAIELLRGAHTGDLFGPDDWEIIDEFLAGSALKPADVFVDPLKSCNVCGDEHICQGCGSKGWTANCKECVPY